MILVTITCFTFSVLILTYTSTSNKLLLLVLRSLASIRVPHMLSGGYSQQYVFSIFNRQSMYFIFTSTKNKSLIVVRRLVLVDPCTLLESLTIRCLVILQDSQTLIQYFDREGAPLLTFKKLIEASKKKTVYFFI